MLRIAFKIMFCALALSAFAPPAHAATSSQTGWHTSIIDAFSANKNNAVADASAPSFAHNVTDTIKGLPVYIGRTSFAPDAQTHNDTQAVLNAVRVGMNFSFD